MRTALPLAMTMLAGCVPEYDLNIQWESEPLDVPLSELMRPCLPPDDSVCEIDLTTGNYEEGCVQQIHSFQNFFASKVEDYILRDGETYDDFIGGDLPTTVYGHYLQSDRENEEDLFLHLVFSRGDTRTGPDPTAPHYHNEIPWYIDSATFPTLYCSMDSMSDFDSLWKTEFGVRNGQGEQVSLSLSYNSGAYFITKRTEIVTRDLECDTNQECLNSEAVSTAIGLSWDIADKAYLLARPETDLFGYHGDAGYYYR